MFSLALLIKKEEKNIVYSQKMINFAARKE